MLDFALLNCYFRLLINIKKIKNKPKKHHKKKSLVAFAEEADFSERKQSPLIKSLIKSICKHLVRNTASVAEALLITLASSGPKLVFFLLFKT